MLIPMLKQKEGFSLVEMIIAIAVLAILSLPVIAYFTNSHLLTENAMSEQRANIAAQSVIEELNQYATFKQITKLPDDSTGIDDTYKIVAGQSDDTHTTLQKNLDMDGIEYFTNITLDYEPYKQAAAAPDGTILTNTSYNAHKVPELKTVHSLESVVFEETDETEIAINDIYSDLQGHKITGVTKTAIKNAITRYIRIEVKEDTNDAKCYVVSGDYQYTFAYGSNTFTYNTNLDIVKIEKKLLKRIFLFYQPIRDGIAEEKGSVSFDSEETAKQISVYYMAQESASLKTASNYRFTIDSGSNCRHTKYYTNKRVYGTGSGAGIDYSEIYYDSSDAKRIAKITVEVYHKGDAMSPENCLAVIESAKSE